MGLLHPVFFSLFYPSNNMKQKKMCFFFDKHVLKLNIKYINIKQLKS